MRSFVLVLALLSGVSTSADRADYFPKHVFGPRSDNFTVNYYGMWLSFFRERSLFEDSKADARIERYRFLWLRTFHPAVVIRVDISDAHTGVLAAKVANGYAGFGFPGRKIVQDMSRPLTPKETQAFLDKVERSGFWSMAASSPPSGEDGAEWILEAEKSGNYHVVKRWSPCPSKRNPCRGDGEGVYLIGRYLALDLAGLKIPERDIY
jgi:hypothetical protein